MKGIEQEPEMFPPLQICRKRGRREGEGDLEITNVEGRDGPEKLKEKHEN